MLLRNNNSLAGRVLAARAQLPSLFNGAAPAAPPSIWSPGDAPTHPQLMAAAQAAPAMPGGQPDLGGLLGQPQAPQQAPQPEQGQQPDPQDPLVARVERQAVIQQGIMQLIQEVTRGSVPAAAATWVQREAAEAAEGGPGQPKAGFLHRLFVGELVPGLSEEQNKQLRRGAMLRAGLAMLAAGAAPLGQVLALGVLTARAYSTRTAGELLDEQHSAQRLAQRASIFADSSLSPLDQYEMLRQFAVAEGDEKMTAQLNDIIKELRAEGAAAKREIREINGRTIAFDPDGTPWDPFTNERLMEMPTPGGKWVYDSNRGVQVNDLTGEVRQLEGLPQPPQGPAEAPQLDSSRLGQLESGLRDLRRAETAVSNIDRSVRQISASLARSGTISSADQRELATRLAQMLDSGNLRESSLDSISASGGLVGNMENLIGMLRGGNASPTVARDLVQAIERNIRASRQNLQRERADAQRRVETVRGITPEEVRATMGSDPFGGDEFGFDALPGGRR
jgi:hypothetical protein